MRTYIPVRRQALSVTVALSLLPTQVLAAQPEANVEVTAPAVEAEVAAPEVETPDVEAPTAEAPAVETPEVEKPAAEAAVEPEAAPEVEAPAVEAPEAAEERAAAPEPPAETTMLTLSSGSGERTPAQKAALGLLAGGGGLAIVGLGIVIGFSVRENNLDQDLQDADEALFGCGLNPNAAECQGLVNEQADLRDKLRGANTGARAGAVLMAVGGASMIAGGIILGVAKKKKKMEETARFRVAPSWGGAVVSGRF